MSTAPLVSVILPTYNRADTLPRAILSVLAQTHADLELIVVDDGSTDETPDRVAAIGDPRIRYLRTGGRRGAAAARNIGARAAQGSWLAFQDSDDEWTSDKLRVQLDAAAAASQPTLVCCWFLLLRASNARPPRLFGDEAWPEGAWNARACYRFSFITPTWLLQRTVFDECGGFDESLPNLEDWEFAFRLIRAGVRVAVVREPLVVKHAVDGGLFRDMRARLTAYETIYQCHQDLWADDEQLSAMFLSEIGRLRCLTGQVAQGRSALGRSMRMAPNMKTALHWLASYGGAGAYLGGRRWVEAMRRRHAQRAR